jgi:hypothetical protein
MSDDRFEIGLRQDLLGLADDGVRPVDAHALAIDLVRAGRPGRPGVLANLRTASHRSRWLVAAALIVLLALLAVIVGARLMLPSGPLGPLAFIRDGALWTAAADGSAQSRIASGGVDRLEYLYARWSPDGRYLLAVRDLGDINLVPALELFDRSGRRLWTRELEPGGLPDVSWAPDSRRFAVAAFPTLPSTIGDLLAPYPKDAISPMTISTLGIDGSAGPLLLRAAAPPFSRPGDSHAEVLADRFIRWSPASDQIAVRALEDTCCVLSLWVVSADGSDRRPLVGRDAAVQPTWFEWRPDGRTIDVLGPNRDESCVYGETVDGVCTAGSWSTDPRIGGATFVPVPGTSGSGGEGNAFVKWLASTVDGRRLARFWAIPGPPVNSARFHPSTRLDVVDVETSTQTVLAEGSWSEADGVDPTEVVGQCVAFGQLVWSSDGARIYHLGIAQGESTTWAIRTIDAATGQGRTLVDHVSQFDLARA